jgi:4-hydroxymandelate synthase
VPERVSGVGFDVLELWVADLDRTRDLLTHGFGLVPLSPSGLPPSGLPPSGTASPRERVAYLGSGGVRVRLRHGGAGGGPVARHVAVHGDTVGDVALLCDDIAGIVERARAHGLQVQGCGDHPRIDMLGDWTLCHTLRPAAGALPGRATPPSRRRPLAVDHVACCLRRGSLDAVASSYEEVFGLERLDVGAWTDDAWTDGAGMRSIPLRSPAGSFTIVLIEPGGPCGGGQIQDFLDAHAGPGIQHAAWAFGDLADVVGWLRGRGVEFLPVPDAYYTEAAHRLEHLPLRWDTLRRTGILVDTEGEGLLLQLFTRPITDRETFFLELIERAGATGFGGNNVKALYAAVAAAAGGDLGQPGRDEET